MYLFLLKNHILDFVIDYKLDLTISAFSVLALGFLCVSVFQLEGPFVAFHSLNGLYKGLFSQGLTEELYEGLFTQSLTEGQLQN